MLAGILVALYVGLTLAKLWPGAVANVVLALSTTFLFSATTSTIKRIGGWSKDLIKIKQPAKSEFEETAQKIGDNALRLEGEPEDDDKEGVVGDGGDRIELRGHGASGPSGGNLESGPLCPQFAEGEEDEEASRRGGRKRRGGDPANEGEENDGSGSGEETAKREEDSEGKGKDPLADSYNIDCKQ